MIKKIPVKLSLQIYSYLEFYNPTYVLQELIENSIDANSNCINVYLEGFGLSLIKVEDNGCGIAKEDLFLSLERNTTSKIFSIHDISKTKFYGVRGDSLAIILSISKIKLISKPENQAFAWGVYVDDFNKNIFPDLYNNGTSISVIDLYYNVIDKLEYALAKYNNYFHVKKLIKKFLLGCYNIKFFFKYDNKSVINYPQCFDFDSKLVRLKRILGKNLVNNSVYIDICDSNVLLKGWFGIPKSVKMGSCEKFIYINDKYVKSSYINNIINYAYYYINNKFLCNFYCIYFYIDASMLNMSLYKTKRKVLFYDENIIYDLLKKSIVNLFSDKYINIDDIDNKIGKFFKISKKDVVSYIKKNLIKIIIGSNVYELLSIFLNKVVLLKFKNKLLIVNIEKCRKLLLWNKCILSFKKAGYLKKFIIEYKIKNFFNNKFNENILSLFKDLGIDLYYDNDCYIVKSFPMIFFKYSINYNLLFSYIFEKKMKFLLNCCDVEFYKNVIYFIIEYISNELAMKELKEILFLIDKLDYKNLKIRSYIMIDINELLKLICLI
ncbi:MAG: ATP-binding protein [Candidatus Azosocius agrarius]|nr:MAG: ATP-binding protein [Gammaproteobacteria bacterium]